MSAVLILFFSNQFKIINGQKKKKINGPKRCILEWYILLPLKAAWAAVKGSKEWRSQKTPLNRLA